MDKSDVVIIGGVACGPKTAATLARRMPEALITLFQKDRVLSYASCGMPWLASGDLESAAPLISTAYGAVRDADYFRDVKGFKAVTQAEVVSINRTDKSVTVREANGTEYAHGYDTLVIATGASPASLPIELPDSPRIKPFHTLEDAIHFRKLAEQGKVGTAAIIGAGLVGVEVAVAIGELWGIEQTLIEREDHVLPYVLDLEMASKVERHMESKGVDLWTGETVTSIELSDDDLPIITCGGRDSRKVDFVFVAAGVRPNVQLAVDCGLELGDTGGIKVNNRMQTSDPSIFAGGDCVESVNRVTGEPLYIPMGSLANRHGRVIAENISGTPSTYDGAVGAFVLKIFDLSVGAVGSSQQALQKSGWNSDAVWGDYQDRPDYMPENSECLAKLIYNGGDDRVLGFQIVGDGDASKRIDVMSAYLQNNGRIGDLLDHEHGYAPPFAEALSPVHHLAAMARAQQRGMNFLAPCPPEAGENTVQWLDVREPEEVESASPGPGFINIPIGELRRRIGELDRTRPVRVICARGPRSYQAAIILKVNGFNSVAVMAGGLQAISD